MSRCLIVANQTLGSGELDAAVRDRIERGLREFFVLVPATPPAQESSVWTFGFDVDTSSSSTASTAAEQDRQRREARFEAKFEAKRRARRRLEQMIEMIAAAGGEASGRVGDADPVTAVKQVLSGDRFEEIILSTLPSGVSRWVKLDLPTRVARMTKAPVTTVEAAEP